MSTSLPAEHAHNTADTELRPALAMRSAGIIEVLRVGRLVRKATDVLRFDGVPASKSSHVRALEVSFVEGDAPSPGIDPASGLIRLFYTKRERGEVERLLHSKRSRYCYFWRSRDGGQRHAWLLTSPR